MAVKLFILEVPVNSTHQKLDLVHHATHKTYTIATFASKDEQLLLEELKRDESCFGVKRKGNRRRGVKNKIPVFGILGRNGKVEVETVKDVSTKIFVKRSHKESKEGQFNIYKQIQRL